MAGLDVFNQNAYSVVEMTNAINKVPYQPSIIGRMPGLFTVSRPTTTKISIESKDGTLSLIKSQPRGALGTKNVDAKRTVRDVTIPYFPHDDEIKADAIQNVRAFGTESTQETMMMRVNEKLQGLRANHEVTHEYLRLGAIHGLVKDGDGTSTLLDLFDLFNVNQQTIDFQLDVATTKVNLKCEAVTRSIQGSLGASTFTGVTALCGDQFFDDMQTHPVVLDAIKHQNDGATKFLLEAQGQGGNAGASFFYKGITFLNYRGKVGGVEFVDTDNAQFFPTGVQGLFNVAFAPADFIESVNTPGKDVYAKQAVQKFEKGIDLHTVSCPLMYCARPSVLVRGTRT